jgi:Ca2+-binding EF-hand superfamily protein
LLSKEKLKAAFQLFDKDGSGAISANEVRDILVGHGKK